MTDFRLRNAVLAALSGLCLLLIAAAELLAEEAIEGRFPATTVAGAVEAEIIDRVPISGTLVPRQEILIYPQVSGYTIDMLNVDIGDRVNAGDVLAELNNRTLTAQLAQAEAEHASSQALERQSQSQITAANATFTQAGLALERTKKLTSAGTMTQASLDQAIASAQSARANLASAMDGLAVSRAQILQTEARLEIAKLNLEHAKVTAPASGLISARNGQVGAIATSVGEPILRLIAGGEIEIEAEVIETALAQVEVGDVVELDIAGVGPVEGKVRLISPLVDPVNRLGMIRIQVEASPDLRAGLYAGGWIIIDQEMSLSVPSSAVLTDAAGSYVLKVEDGVITKQEVVAGLIWKGNRAVLEGLTLSDSVVAKAGAFFADGDQITPIFEEDVPVKGQD